jgi:hypothetical protein
MRNPFLAVALVVLFATGAGAGVAANDNHDLQSTTVDGLVVYTQPVQRHNALPPDSNTPQTRLAGSINPISEFTGPMVEELEPPSAWYYGPPGFRAFDDSADMWSGAYYKGIYGVGSTCTVYAYQGSGLGGSWSGATEILFDEPIGKFGGYFADIFYAGFPWDPTASFYDESDILIDTVSMDVPVGCAWTWNGWEAVGTTIKRVVLHSGYSSGQYLFMDSLTADVGGGGGGDCDLTPVLDALEALEAKADTMESKADALDALVATRASQASVDAIEVKVDSIDADVDVTVSSRASQDSVDALEVKTDTIQSDMPCEVIQLFSLLPGLPAVPTTHPCYEPPITIGGGINTPR